MKKFCSIKHLGLVVFAGLALGISNVAKADAEPTATATENYGKSTGVLGPVVLGPNIVLLGLPSPFRIGLESKYNNIVGLSFDYGFLPSLTFSNVKVSYNSFRFTGRFYPWRRAFFIGLGVGNQSFNGETTVNVAPPAGAAVPVNIKLNVSTTIFTPQIGWHWVWDSGFFFGMELGVQLAGSNSAKLDTDVPPSLVGNADYQKNKADVEDKGKTYGQQTLPHFAAVKLGYFF